eukprot:CAMPEP_0170494322 /NCGR_PEP_ID=MMETSP0208-20121228/14579_1 /TAXON_ID=197538 /ORGANISM="Strombidium inclinatum, Strain S3" /LENGTH=101 /DNA_ID=CAMNT_0010770365 /DNA_START=31 /DNA_END=336 /DNA_ORIENTATION=-
MTATPVTIPKNHDSFGSDVKHHLNFSEGRGVEGITASKFKLNFKATRERINEEDDSSFDGNILEENKDGGASSDSDSLSDDQEEVAGFMLRPIAKMSFKSV